MCACVELTFTYAVRHCCHISTSPRVMPYSGTYSLFRVFSPECTLHTAITHVISVLER